MNMRARVNEGGTDARCVHISINSCYFTPLIAFINHKIVQYPCVMTMASTAAAATAAALDTKLMSRMNIML